MTDTPALQYLAHVCSAYRIRWVRSWEELGVAARTVSAFAVAVVDPFLGGDGGLAPGLQRLLARPPLLALVVAVPPGAAAIRVAEGPSVACRGHFAA